jgi:hypothetical protein
MMNEVTSPVPYDHFDNSGSFAPILPAAVEEEPEDQTQDPTWEPERHQKLTVTADRTPGLGEESGPRYWLRKRQREQPVE